ncbi:MAG: SPOR domain-containing protein [Candidatus Omnitrophica bacterium]|nr:SPOR domain-containing protein [Candidatus Omnitrophota bacterium]
MAEQLELFSLNTDSEIKAAINQKNDFNYQFLRRYEKILFSLILVSISCCIAFCLGVERGKRIAMAKSGMHLDLASSKEQKEDSQQYAAKEQIGLRTLQLNPKETFTIQGNLNNVPVQQEIILEPSKKKSPEKLLSTNQQGYNYYTIQVASYKTKETAQRESQRLKKSGLSVLIRESGGYTIVCVGQFLEKEKAQSLLTKLKSRYRDCYIRRL